MGDGSINDESISRILGKSLVKMKIKTVEAIVNKFKSFLENKITPKTSLGFSCCRIL